MKDRGPIMGFPVQAADLLLTVSEVALALRVPKSWVYDHVRPSANPVLPHVKLGKYLRFRRQDIEDFLDRVCPRAVAK